MREDMSELCANDGDQQTPSTSAEPLVIRFPAPPRRHVIRCKWFQCDVEFPTVFKLVEHLQHMHVEIQEENEVFLCLWEGCKVHGQASSYFQWMENHVLQHGHKDPFACKVVGCGKLFSTKNLLKIHAERHSKMAKKKGKKRGKKEDSSAVTKLQLRKFKKLKIRQPPSKGNAVDYIDQATIEGMIHQMAALSGPQKRKATLDFYLSWNCKHAILKSQVLARRVVSDGPAELLVRWLPGDILPDEWVLESEFKTSHEVPLSRLPPPAANRLYDSLQPPKSARRPRKATRPQQQQLPSV